MNKLNHKSDSEQGASLLELMAVVLIIAIMTVMTMPMLHEQLAAREIETLARRFIAHAQFARGQALQLGMAVHITPSGSAYWEDGWVVKNACPPIRSKADCAERTWFAQGAIAPIYFKGGGKQFMDPHSNKRGITFNAAGAAKTAQGGFVANRLILGHERDSGLERQLILSSGGRWRVCDPQRDSKACR
ncbi:GspH/FimT family pseudopilin [Polynucleobacter brandtiae]|nr:GspH/FimT family pseudopilin [Polynucleobacter brandtiae]